MQATGTEARVCEDIAARQRKGIAKYKTTVAGNPSGNSDDCYWLRHAYLEALDFAIYLRREIERRGGEVNHD